MIKFFLWPLACGLWVAAPILGWEHGVHPRISQMGWWMMASIGVIAVALTEKPKREIPSVFGFLLVGCFLISIAHWSNFGLGSAWLLQASLLLCAAYLIAERGHFFWLRKIFLLCALIQVPVWILQRMGIQTVWLTAGPPPWGTVMKRGALSILFGLASIWSHCRGIACFFAFLAILTGSFSGAVPAVLRLFFSSSFVPFPTLLFLLIVLPLLLFPLWLPRLLLRVSVWKSFPLLKGGWLTGWGFLPFPSGFQEDSGHATWASPFFREYHSSIVDWLARNGAVGLLILILLSAWIIRRTQGAADWRKWTLILALCTAGTQSAESFPFLIMLFLTWLIGLCYEKRDSTVYAAKGDSHVDKIQVY